MASRRLRRRVASRRKLNILQTLSKSKSVKKSNIIMHVLTYILKMKLHIQAITSQYHCKNIQKVKVDAVGSNRLVVKVRCLKGEGLLVRILEAMEEMNLRVLQARASSQLSFFAMDAILEAHQNHFSADAITQAILKAIDDQKSYETHK
ncbi:uncharacterized protein LOC116033358 [Ipomoea triloba]|uniref:uncharacterized protein LOC116033358 n=1 Tax=Ipomoea triloba TaxID=35885 RepID=UPI00125E0F3C|nr:uncharacterized protein LOC116033358 [Ipomoea triloba]